LDVSKLQELNNFINQEASRVKIELEIPNKKGEYQTNIAQYIESIPKERFCGISKYYDFLCSKEEEYEYSKEDIEFDFKGLIKKLKKLPRITRQFYAFMLERGEFSDVTKFINADYLERICSFPDMKGELRLLEQAELCSFITPDEYGESAKYYINFPSKVKNSYFVFEFQEYIESERISLESVIVSLDFFDFD
ncbi:hypothetical protein CGK10_23635, partial [Vibrio parahaemolyticus]|uniref:hypothetical protein n=1 Tax=Vibrio parahaemolyticus TaxID=670 RepID=UPI00116F23CC